MTKDEREEIRQLREENRRLKLIEEEWNRLAAILENTSDMISTSTPDGQITYMNKAGRNLLGWEHSSDFFNKSIADAHPAWALQHLDKEGIPSAEQNGIWRGETALLGKDNKEIPVSQVIMSHKDNKGDIKFLSTIIRDITRHKEAEQALLESREKYRALFYDSHDAFMIVSKEEGFISGNPSTVALFGCKDEEEFTSKTPAELSPLLQPCGTTSRAKAKQMMELALNKGSHFFEWRHKRIDGSEFDATVLLTRMQLEGKQFLQATVRDVTERKRANEELERLRLLLSRIIDSMPSVLIAVDRELRVNQWNREAEKITGISTAEAMGKRVDIVFPVMKAELDKVEAAIGESKIKQNPRAEFHSGKTPRFLDITIYPLKQPGTEKGHPVDGAVIRIDDITQRIRMEEMMIQSEKMMSVGGLAAGMAHEINNPLAGILQGIQVLNNRLMNNIPKNTAVAGTLGIDMEAIKEYSRARNIPELITSIMDSGHRAAKIVENMLSFSRKSDSSLAPADLSKLLDQTIALAANDYNLKKKYDFRQIKIIRQYQPDMPEILCEPTKIQQVFLNLLKNGAQAMAEGKADQPAFVLSISQEENMARVEFRDNGPGMDESVRRRIFEPFFTTKDTASGTGLGLSVSYFIITKNHSGKMTVESSPGKGTTFIIQLPLERSSDESKK